MKIWHAYSDVLNHLKVFLLHYHDRWCILKKHHLLPTPNLYLFKSNTSKSGSPFPTDKRKKAQNSNSFKNSKNSKLKVPLKKINLWTTIQGLPPFHFVLLRTYKDKCQIGGTTCCELRLLSHQKDLGKILCILLNRIKHYKTL